MATLLLSISISAQFTHPPTYTGNTVYWDDGTIEIFDEGGFYLTADNRNGEEARMVRRSKTTGEIVETLFTVPNDEGSGQGFISRFIFWGPINAPRSVFMDGNDIYILAKTRSGNMSVLVYNKGTSLFSRRLSLINGSFNGFVKVGTQVYVLASTLDGTVNLSNGTTVNRSSRLRIGIPDSDARIQADGTNIKIQSLLIAINSDMSDVRVVKHFNNTQFDYEPRNKTIQNFSHDKILLSFNNADPFYSHFVMFNPSTGAINSKEYDSSIGGVTLNTDGDKILGVTGGTAFIMNLPTA